MTALIGSHLCGGDCADPCTDPDPVREAPIRPFGDSDRAILEFERLRFHTPGGKQAEILDRFAMTPVTYYVRLNWIVDQPEALEYDAVLVHRLQRLRDRRRAVRTSGTVAAGVASRPDMRGIRPALGGAL